jgi:hypothetical protein
VKAPYVGDKGNGVQAAAAAQVRHRGRAHRGQRARLARVATRRVRRGLRLVRSAVLDQFSSGLDAFSRYAVGGLGPEVSQTTQWVHGLGEIVTAASAAGLRIEALTEWFDEARNLKLVIGADGRGRSGKYRVPAQVLRPTGKIYYRCPSNLPLRTSTRKVSHCVAVNPRTAPLGFLLSRIPTRSRESPATSTQFPFPQLSELLRHPWDDSPTRARSSWPEVKEFIRVLSPVRVPPCIGGNLPDKNSSLDILADFGVFGTCCRERCALNWDDESC